MWKRFHSRSAGSVFNWAGGLVIKPPTVKRIDKKVGRNDPCPCGSGKKYQAMLRN
ncbi:MAG: SEC-C domain-containing protein [Rhodopseudomonas palustris]|nr:SEC-C domain-containing protein [Rhodopseudomonas palustris]